MPKYRVKVQTTRVSTGEVIVEADNELEAREVASYEIDENDIDFDEDPEEALPAIEVLSIEEFKEEE